ncbi:hypothetical protein B0I35DRAFT_169459 [Stachybotrys elegans]|uniref:Uncharacterized protein n=1 Tax=Stachybotrys elegans TaxID=80388 RepID=A0A8K0WVS1_9HYPO|nr:hypothetical protein B0I35DRAFT_169459 [Stachybotrys elegans]
MPISNISHPYACSSQLAAHCLTRKNPPRRVTRRKDSRDSHLIPDSAGPAACVVIITQHACRASLSLSVITCARANERTLVVQPICLEAFWKARETRHPFPVLSSGKDSSARGSGEQGGRGAGSRCCVPDYQFPFAVATDVPSSPCCDSCSYSLFIARTFFFGTWPRHAVEAKQVLSSTVTLTTKKKDANHCLVKESGNKPDGLSPLWPVLTLPAINHLWHDGRMLCAVARSMLGHGLTKGTAVLSLRDEQA